MMQKGMMQMMGMMQNMNMTQMMQMMQKMQTMTGQITNVQMQSLVNNMSAEQRQMMLGILKDMGTSAPAKSE